MMRLILKKKTTIFFFSNIGHVFHHNLKNNDISSFLFFLFLIFRIMAVLSPRICLVSGCQYYENEGCYGTCSLHSKYKGIKIISFCRPNLPKEVLNLIWEFFYIDHESLLSDEEIMEYIGAEKYVEPSHIDELVHWFQHTNQIPFIHCDNIIRAFQLLRLPPKKFVLRTHDAIRMMRAIHERHDSRYLHYTKIAFEKVFVLLTAHNAALPNDLFPIGKCYFEGRTCKKWMSREQIQKNLQYNSSNVGWTGWRIGLLLW